MPEPRLRDSNGTRYDGVSLAAAMSSACEKLARAGIEEPMVDVRRLACAATGQSAAELLASRERPLRPDERATLDFMVTRRAGREPVSRILGWRGFWNLDLVVTPAVLDPRPETETLVEAALELAREMGARRPLRILDIGTGSGAVILALLSELRDAKGVGSDISAAALEVARENARRHGLSDRVDFRLADGLDGIEGPFDIVVSNPPYIETNAIAALEPEVTIFDPRAALDGGADGLAAYRKFATSLPRVLPHGAVAFEVGAGQHDAVIEILRSALAPKAPLHFTCRRELSGMTRVVAAKTQD